MALSYSEQLQLTLIDKGLIGLLLVVAGFAFNSMLERFKSNQTKALDALRSDLTLQLEKQREQRTAIGDFARKISVGYQAMEWFTWTAKNDTSAFSSGTEIDTYNSEMKKVFPDIVAARVAAAAVNAGHEEAIEEISGALYGYDIELATLIAKYKNAQGPADRLAALKEIGETHEEIGAADRAFIERVSEIVGGPRAKKAPLGQRGKPLVAHRD
jgi:hypothetical protein